MKKACLSYLKFGELGEERLSFLPPVWRGREEKRARGGNSQYASDADNSSRPTPRRQDRVGTGELRKHSSVYLATSTTPAHFISQLACLFSAILPVAPPIGSVQRHRSKVTCRMIAAAVSFTIHQLFPF